MAAAPFRSPRLRLSDGARSAPSRHRRPPARRSEPGSAARPARGLPPARISPPRSRTFSPETTGTQRLDLVRIRTTTRSIGTTASAPSGTTPPVEISIASPAAERARFRTARGNPTDDPQHTRQISRPDGEPVHGRARERRQVDAGPRALGEHAPAGAGERDDLGRQRRRAGEHTVERLLDGQGAAHDQRYVLHQAYGVPSRRDLGRHPRARRGAQRRAALRRAGGCARRRRPRLGGGVRRRRLDRRHVRGPHPAARRPRQRPRRPAAPELRQGRRARHRLRRGRGRHHRHDRRRPAGRPGRDPAAAREARRGLRPRLGLEDEAARPAHAAHPVEDLQLGHGPGLGGAPARHELRAQGLPRGGRPGHAAVRRAPPLHPGARPLSRLPHRRAAREPPPAGARPLALRRRAVPARVPRSPHGDVHGPLPAPAAAPVRRPRPAHEPARAGRSSST